MRILDNNVDEDADLGGDGDDDDDDDEGGDDDDDDDDDQDSRLAADQIPGRRQVATCVTPRLISCILWYFTHFTLTNV